MAGPGDFVTLVQAGLVAGCVSGFNRWWQPLQHNGPGCTFRLRRVLALQTRQSAGWFSVQKLPWLMSANWDEAAVRFCESESGITVLIMAD